MLENLLFFLTKWKRFSFNYELRKTNGDTNQWGDIVVTLREEFSSLAEDF